MDGNECDTSSFIVKVWCEEPAGEPGSAVWRGHITHVPSGRRQYFEDPYAIVQFVVSYLADSPWTPRGEDRTSD